LHGLDCGVIESDFIIGQAEVRAAFLRGVHFLASWSNSSSTCIVEMARLW